MTTLTPPIHPPSTPPATPSRAASAPPVPYRSIRATKGFSALNLGEIFHYRDLLVTLAIKDIKVRYKQTALGIAWVVIQPLIAAVIFSFVFGKVANISTGPIPYIVFSFASFLAWNLFSGIVTRISTCLTNNSHLISKVFFPRLVLPLSTVPTFFLDFTICLGVLAAFIIPNLNNIHLGLPLLLFPVWIALLTLLAVGLGIYFAALNVTYRDVQYIVPVAMQMLMYASPIAYPSSVIENQKPYLQALFHLNPLTNLLEGFRWSVLGSAPPHWGWALYSTAVTIAIFFLGALIFKRMERKFADII